MLISMLNQNLTITSKHMEENTAKTAALRDRAEKLKTERAELERAWRRAQNVLRHRKLLHARHPGGAQGRRSPDRFSR
jgi:hypothetical protein